MAIRCLVGIGIAVVSAGAAASARAGTVTARELALMPLPLVAYGPAAQALPIALDSGVVSNAEAAQETNEGASAAVLARLGRLTGYMLDYGSKIPSGRGVTEVQTTVEQYRTAAAAAAGLAFWRKDDADVAAAKASGIAVTFSRFAPAGLGTASFGDLGSVELSGEPTVYGADVGFVAGSLVGEVSITASTPTLSRPLAQAAALKLRARIRAVLKGRISGAPVALPAIPKAGPPLHGPSPASLALTAADVDGTVAHQGYLIDTSLDPVSEYERSLVLAGDAGLVQEEVTLFRTPDQARYELTILADFALSQRAWKAQAGLGDPIRSFSPKPVTIHAGNEAHGVLGLAHLANGRSVYLAFILMRVGSVIEYITVATPSEVKLLPSALAQLATIAANRAVTRTSTIPVA